MGDQCKEFVGPLKKKKIIVTWPKKKKKEKKTLFVGYAYIFKVRDKEVGRGSKSQPTSALSLVYLFLINLRQEPQT